MRFGRNPQLNRQLGARVPRVTVGVIVYIPFLSGYFVDALDVLKLSLASLRAHTDEPFSLFVIDNASCSEVRDFLLREHQTGSIDYLVLNRENVGKVGAWNILFGAAPGEVLAYSDSDVFFKAGWLEKHLSVLEGFPDVGMVTGLPMRHQTDVYTAPGYERIKTNESVQIEEGDLISRDAMEAYCKGVGKDIETYRQRVVEQRDIRLQVEDVQAYLGACHFQFVARVAELRALIPFHTDALLGPGGDYGGITQFDEAIAARKLLRLSTTDVCIHHIGNRMTERWRAWSNRLNASRSSSSYSEKRAMTGWEVRLSRSRIVKPWLMRIYDYLFRLYSTPPS